MVGESFFCPTANSSAHINNTQTDNINNGWNQVPPIYMPWTSLPENQVTRFSGETLSEPTIREPPDLRVTPWIAPESSWDVNKTCKRKCGAVIESETLEEPIRKQLVTEEKIAAHMSRLHISTTTSQDQLQPDHAPDLPVPSSQSDKSEDVLEKFKLKNGARLVLSEEFRSLRQETCLPAALLDHLTRPTMAVVLWQPPGSAVNSIISAIVNQRIENEPPTPPAQPPQPEPAAEEDSNNNEPMDNLNWNVNGAPAQPSDIDMEDQDL